MLLAWRKRFRSGSLSIVQNSEQGQNVIQLTQRVRWLRNRGLRRP
jgi:hypothetical protein